MGLHAGRRERETRMRKRETWKGGLKRRGKRNWRKRRRRRRRRRKKVKVVLKCYEVKSAAEDLVNR